MYTIILYSLWLLKYFMIIITTIMMQNSSVILTSCFCVLFILKLSPMGTLSIILLLICPISIFFDDVYAPIPYPFIIINWVICCLFIEYWELLCIRHSSPLWDVVFYKCVISICSFFFFFYFLSNVFFLCGSYFLGRPIWDIFV